MRTVYTASGHGALAPFASAPRERSMDELKDTIYSLQPAASSNLRAQLIELHERVELLRSQGILTPETLLVPDP